MSAPKQITLKTVLHEINEPGAEFSLTFRTLGGDLCVKDRVKKNPTKAADLKPDTKKDLTSIQHQQNQTDELILYDIRERHPFKCFISLLITFNDYEIYHSF